MPEQSAMEVCVRMRRARAYILHHQNFETGARMPRTLSMIDAQERDLAGRVIHLMLIPLIYLAWWTDPCGRQGNVVWHPTGAPDE